MYKNRISSIKYPQALSGTILLFAGMVILFFQYLIAVAMILSGLAVLMTHRGVMIDGKKRKIRYYVNFFGLRIGKWEKLGKNLLAIVVKEHKDVMIVKKGSELKPIDGHSESFDIYLIYKGSSFKRLLFKGRDLEHTLKYARKIAKVLKLDVKFDFRPLTRKSRIRNLLKIQKQAS